MFVLSLLIFSGENSWSRISNTSSSARMRFIWKKSKFGQRWSNPSWSRVFQDFRLIITQETPRFMCLFPCLLWQVKNRARAKTVQQESIFTHFSLGKSIYQLGKSIYQDRILAKTSNFQVLRHLAPIFTSWSPKNNSTTTF